MVEDDIIGFWRVTSVDMIEGVTVSILPGLAGEIVEFSSEGEYILHIPGRSRASRCRFLDEPDFVAFDTWIVGLEGLVTRSIARRNDNLLSVCIAGNYGHRPTELRRDDAKLWVMKEFERVERPVKKPKEPRKRPPGLIPKGLLSDDG
jgi:hypothetical protein